MSDDPVAALVEDVDALTEDPRTLGAGELVELYGTAERLRGLTLAFRAANDSLPADTDAAPLTRLRNALRALRGQRRVVGEGGGARTVEELRQLTEETDDVIADRAEAFQDALAAQLDDGADTTRGFH